MLKEYWDTDLDLFDKIICSPLKRAVKTAEILVGERNNKIEFNSLWMERNNGKLAGLYHEEALKVLPPPDNIPLFQPIAITGESQWDLYLRAGTALNEIIKYHPGHYLIISHGGFLNMVMHAIVGLVPQANFQGPNFRFSNTGYTTVIYQPNNNSWVIREHNNTNHLKST
jgi:broad specificity phosphatase PhoE